jgi:hypothetical protein
MKRAMQRTYRSNTVNYTDPGIKSQLKNYDFVSPNRSNESQSYIKFQDFRNSGNKKD